MARVVTAAGHSRLVVTSVLTWMALVLAIAAGSAAAPDAQAFPPLPAGFIDTVAGDGMAGFAGDGGDATAARLSGPQGVAVDAAGHLYIADTVNHCIRRVDADTNVITTVAGTVTGGFSGDGGPAAAAELDRPTDVAFDAAGNLFIVDGFNHRVRRIDVGTGPSRPWPAVLRLPGSVGTVGLRQQPN